MRKILLALCLLLPAVTGWAEARHPSWNAPGVNEFPNSTPLYVKINVLGDGETYVQQVAAFVNGECRAESTSPNNRGIYVLRVWGDLEEENGAAITFRVMCGSLEYSFTHTEVFDGEADAHTVPIELTLNPLVGIELTNPITIEALLPVTYDLSNDIKLVYAEEQATPTSKLETALKYTWDFANSEAFIEVDGNNILTAKQDTSEDGAYLGLNVEGELKPDSSVVYTDDAWTRVVVKRATIAVESIAINPSEVTAYVGDPFSPLIRNLEVTVLPENASSKDWAYEIVQESTAWVDRRADVIMQPGTHQVRIYSVSNPEVYAMLTINVKTPVSLTWDADIVECSTITPGTFTLTMTGDDFDPTKVEIVPRDEVYNSDSPFYALNPSGDGLTWEIHGKYVGSYAFEVYYDGNLIIKPNQQYAVDVYIKAEIPYGAGWNWISVYANDDVTNNIGNEDDGYAGWIESDVIEIRSQEQLLYNDPELGVFGMITELNSSDGMYKMKTNKAGALIFGEPGMEVEVNHIVDPISMVKGYNWFTYPHEFDLSLEEISAINRANEGDMIIGKDAFATFDGAKWVQTNGFKLEAGKGYIYYCPGANGGRLNLSFSGIPACYDPDALSGQGGNVKGVNGDAEVWKFDASRFADNMAIIASVEGLRNPEQYTIGAFVGEECRGKGSLAQDDIMFINVAGKSGEKVTFRLYNTFTGEYFDVNETVTYSAKAGTLRAPVRLSSPVVTGISSVKSAQDGGAIFNLAGQRLDKMQKGINIVGGRKVLR